MIITDESTTSRGKPKESQGVEGGDILNMKKFNSLPSPVTARMCGGGEYWIETLCVQTGCMHLDVCGQLDLSHISELLMFIDANGNEHNPDDFYL